MNNLEKKSLKDAYEGMKEVIKNLVKSEAVTKTSHRTDEAISFFINSFEYMESGKDVNQIVHAIKSEAGKLKMQALAEYKDQAAGGEETEKPKSRAIVLKPSDFKKKLEVTTYPSDAKRVSDGKAIDTNTLFKKGVAGVVDGLGPEDGKKVAEVKDGKLAGTEKFIDADKINAMNLFINTPEKDLAKKYKSKTAVISVTEGLTGEKIDPIGKTLAAIVTEAVTIMKILTEPSKAKKTAADA